MLAFYLPNGKTRRKDNNVRFCLQRTPSSNMRWLWKYQAAHFSPTDFYQEQNAWLVLSALLQPLSFACSTLSLYKSSVHVFYFWASRTRERRHTRRYLSNHSRWNTSLHNLLLLEQNKKEKETCHRHGFAHINGIHVRPHVNDSRRIFICVLAILYCLTKWYACRNHTHNDSLWHLSLLRSCCGLPSAYYSLAFHEKSRWTVKSKGKNNDDADSK